MCGVSVFSGLLRPAPTAGGNGGATPEEQARRAHLAATGNPNPGAGGRGADGGRAQAGLQTPRRLTAAACLCPRHAVLPFGVTLLAPSWTDEYVAGVAAAFQAATGLAAGPLGHGVAPYVTPAAAAQ